jgi:hypothetical protein
MAVMVCNDNGRTAPWQILPVADNIDTYRNKHQWLHNQGKEQPSQDLAHQ